jgi:hypothetical protein
VRQIQRRGRRNRQLELTKLLVDAWIRFQKDSNEYEEAVKAFRGYINKDTVGPTSHFPRLQKELLDLGVQYATILKLYVASEPKYNQILKQ